MTESIETAVVDRSVPGDRNDEGRLVDASRGRLIAVLLAIVLLCEIVPFQYSVVGISVREIAPSFPTSGDNVTWMMTIFGLVGGATMALFGKMADIWGKKRVLMGLSVLFLIGSVICAVTSSWTLFLVGRGLQATSLAVSVACFGLVRDIMPRSWVPVTVGFIGTGAGISTIAAPLIGGVLTDNYSWRSIFWFLVVYMVLVIPLFIAVVPETRLRVKEQLDVVGAILIGLGVAGLLIYVTEGSVWGWTAGSSLAYLTGGVIILVAFWIWEHKASNPLVEPALLRTPEVSMVLAIQFLGAIVLVGFGYAVAYMFQTSGAEVRQAILENAAAQAKLPVSTISKAIQFKGDIGYARGFSLLEFVLHITLWTSIAALFFGPLGGVWVRRVGPRIPLIAGLVAMLCASALLVPWHSTWQEQVAIGIIFLAGGGLFYTALPNIIIETVPRERQGISAGMLGVAGGFGIAFGTALLTAILVRHPFQIVSLDGKGNKTVTDIPQVYTDTGFGHIYLFVCLGGSILALLLAVALKAGRTPATGGLNPLETVSGSVQTSTAPHSR